MSKFLLSLVLLLITACENTTPPTQTNSLGNDTSQLENTSWVFVANEGTYGASNGSISMIDEYENIYETEAIGDVVQSIAVYRDKLIAIVNNSHEIKVYDITGEGLSMPGIAISTEESSPREMVILDGMVYFTNWETSDVKVLNLYTYNIDASIPVGSNPEGIITDGTDIWVANSDGTTLSKINTIDYSVESIEVGQGPQNLVMHNDAIYVSRTFYNDDWTETYHGATKIDGEITIKSYGIGVACGGSVLIHNSHVMRSFEGGLARMDSELNLEEVTIGNFSQSQVYHVEKINNNFWFAITDYEDLNEVHVLDSSGSSVSVYDVGQNPGDFAVWPNEVQ